MNYGKNPNLFLKYLEKNKEDIIKIIPKLTGFKWQRGVIFIYICKNFPFEGMSDPLILRFNPDIDMMFYHFLHELVHVNLMNKEILSLRKKIKLLKPGHDGLEVIVSLVVKYTLQEIWSENKIKKIIEKDMKMNKAHKRMWTNVKKLGWDLSKIPLNKYFGLKSKALNICK